jgi:hypothetical protein
MRNTDHTRIYSTFCYQLSYKREPIQIAACINGSCKRNMRWYHKYSGLVPQSIQQLW